MITTNPPTMSNKSNEGTSGPSNVQITRAATATTTSTKRHPASFESQVDIGRLGPPRSVKA